MLSKKDYLRIILTCKTTNLKQSEMTIVELTVSLNFSAEVVWNFNFDFKRSWKLKNTFCLWFVFVSNSENFTQFVGTPRLGTQWFQMVKTRQK